MEKISAVYKIVNTVTGDFYVGSSKNVMRRWGEHKRPYEWERNPNKPLYQDMKKYGVEKFRFQILAPVESEHLKQVEQEFIETLNPTYNNYNAKGWDIGKRKESQIKFRQSKKGDNRPCLYNGDVLKFRTLAARFRRAGIKHYTAEASKYSIGEGEE